MKGKIISLNIRYVVYIVSLMLAVVAIYFLLPKEDNFDRYFEIGKPWAYETVMAPKDFAIYKSDVELEKERAEALKYLEPYLVNTKLANSSDKSQGSLTLDSHLFIDDKGVTLSNRHKNWVIDRLNEVYAVGVMSLQDKQELERLGVEKAIVLAGNSVIGKVLLSDILTPKTAYDYILLKAGEVAWIDDNLLRTANIAEYIEPNVIIDRVKTDQAIQIIFDGVMLTSGMVQKGEKVIDKGEVVTEETYQILKSLQRAVDGEEEFQTNNDVWRVIGNISLNIIAIIIIRNC